MTSIFKENEENITLMFMLYPERMDVSPWRHFRKKKVIAHPSSTAEAKSCKR